MASITDRKQTVLEVIAAEAAKPYDHKASDCFKAACALVDALTGGDWQERFGARYKTLLGAQKALRAQGHTDLAGFFREHLPEIEPARAQFGDLAVISFDGQDHAAICAGAFWCRTVQGDRLFSLDVVNAAFKVG